MGRLKDKKKTLKLVKDNGESSNTLGNYTGVGTVTFYLNKKWKTTEKYYGNIFQGKKHGYGEYNYQNGDFYQGMYEHGKKNGIGTYFYNMNEGQERGKGRGAKGRDDESSEEEENSVDEKSDDEKSSDEQDDEQNEQNGKDEDSEKGTSEEEGENDQSGSDNSGSGQSGDAASGEDQSGEDQSEGDTEQSDPNEQDKEKSANADGNQNSKGNKAADNKKNASKKLLHLLQKWNNTKMKKETIIPAKEKGSFYYGNYANGLKHNEGMMLYRNGDVYVGGWKFGKKSGWGRYTYKKCKSVLEGQWEDGYLTQGKWILPNGMYFVGNFKNNKPSGDGVWAFEDRTQLNVFYYEVKQKFKKSPKKDVGQDPDILLNYKPLYITSTR
ncbi:MORN repeat protein, putative [Plasmodium vivax]|nr:MORN repeat protein, putative [Plasmodium vivax]